MKIKDIIKTIEDFAPPCLALPDDKIGLQVGNPSQRINKILVTLDVTRASTAAAVKIGADLIISHHPLIFEPLKKIETPTILEPLLKNKIAVYVSHTNLDSCTGGVNDVLAEKIGLTDTKVFEPTFTEKLYKLSVFVPQTHAQQVRTALCGAGAGHIGNYDQCTFLSHGIGTFRPLSGATPHIGKKGVIERIGEAKIETIVSGFKIKDVLSAMLKVHPYEEVAYDVYTLENPGRVFGLGRVGRLKKSTDLKTLSKIVKKNLRADNIQIIGNLKTKIKTAVVWSGRGRGKIQAAKDCGADVFIAGEIMYEDILHAKELGLAVIIAGHFESENVIVKSLADKMTQAIPNIKIACF